MLTITTFLSCLVVGWLVLRSFKESGFGLSVMWAMYAFEQLLQQYSRVFVAYSSAVNIAFAMTAIIALMFHVNRGGLKGFSPPNAYFSVYGLFGFAAASYMWSISPSDTVSQLRSALPYIVAFVMVSPLLATGPAAVGHAINGTLALGSVVLLGLFFSEIGRRGVILAEKSGNVLEGNPLAVASYAGTVAMCAMFRIQGISRPKPLSLFYMCVLLLALWMIVRSGSRGQMVALIIAAVVCLPLTARLTVKKSVILPLLFVAAISFLAVYLVQNSSLGGRWKIDLIANDSAGRVAMATALLSEYLRAGPLVWLLGLGSSASYEVVGFYPHIVPAEVLGELGVLGFALLVYFCRDVIRTSFLSFKTASSSTSEGLALGLLLSLFVFHGLLIFKQGSLLGSTAFFGVGLTLLAGFARRPPLVSGSDVASRSDERHRDPQRPVVGSQGGSIHRR